MKVLVTSPSVGSGVLRGSGGLGKEKTEGKVPRYQGCHGPFVLEREHDILTFPLWDASRQRGLGGGVFDVSKPSPFGLDTHALNGPWGAMGAHRSVVVD